MIDSHRVVTAHTGHFYKRCSMWLSVAMACFVWCNKLLHKQQVACSVAVVALLCLCLRRLGDHFNHAISIVVKLHIIITTLNLMASGSLAGTHQILRTANTWELQFNGIFQLWTELCCDKYRGDVSSAGARLKLHRLWSCINAAVRVSCCFVNVKFRRGPF